MVNIEKINYLSDKCMHSIRQCATGYDSSIHCSQLPEVNLFLAIIESAFKDITLHLKKYRKYGRKVACDIRNEKMISMSAYIFLKQKSFYFPYVDAAGVEPTYFKKAVDEFITTIFEKEVTLNEIEDFIKSTD